MRTTLFCFFTLLVLSLSSCSEKESPTCSITIQLILPEGYATLPLEEMKVSLINKDQGNIYTASCSSNGTASLEIEYGFYTASVHYQTSSGLLFSGRLESVSLLPGQEVATIRIPLSRSQTNALVIKEIYYDSSLGYAGNIYQADQYITLYNNSEEAIYLDGLCIGVVDPTSSLQSPWMKYTDMARIPVNDLTWQFPGSGKEYPLAPGAETTIATNAVDHTGGEYQQTNSVDLSKVDWGFWEVNLISQNITPGVKPLKLLLNLNPNLIMYSFPSIGPTIMVFKIKDAAAEIYVSDPGNREPRPQAANKNKNYLMIPKAWVIDCVECVESASQVPFKRVPNELDNGAAYIPSAPFSGKALIRKSTMGSAGHLIYQDTNNSTEDMIVSTPSLRNK